jgi:HK97 family phage major capsid protein
MTQRDLIDKRSRIFTQMEDFEMQSRVEGLTEARKAELEESFYRAEKEHAEISKQIERMQSIDEARKREVAQMDEDPNFRNEKEREIEYYEVFEKLMRRGKQVLSGPELAVLEKRGTDTQIAGTDSLGGYTVPTDLQNRIIEAMKSYSGILSAATIFSTAGGNPINWPFNDDTSATAVLTAESAAVAVGDTTFSQIAMSAYKYTTLVKLSNELLRDTAFNLEQYFTNIMAKRFGRAMNTSCTTGSGSSQPQGVVTGSTLGKTAAATTAITFQEIIDLKHSVDPEYRMGPSSGFMLHDVVLAYLKKLSIGSGDARPLWQPSYVVGEPDTIDGSRYWINQGMDSSINAASKLILYGDFSTYLIRQVQGMEIKRNDALYMNTDEVGFYGFARWDGKLTDTTAVKHLITAAS